MVPGIIFRFFVCSACLADASWLRLIENLKLHAYPAPVFTHPLLGSIPEQSDVLHTYVTSFPPLNTVLFAIVASNFPCLATMSFTSSSVAPAISMMMYCFPVPPRYVGRSCDDFMVRSVNPYTLSLCCMLLMSMSMSCGCNCSSGWSSTLVPPCRSNPFLMFVVDACSTFIPSGSNPI